MIRPLEVRRLQAGYGARAVLVDISLHVDPGEWYVLLGPNGCGKSTLLDCVVGRKALCAGDVVIGGYLLRTHEHSAKRHLGYGCAQEILPGLLTARQCLEIHAGAKGLAAIGSDLFDLAEDLRFTPYLNSFVDTLSLGTRQKLSVLLTLIGDPQLIVLDEAFNGLDPASAQILKRHLRGRLDALGSGLLLATHSLDIVEHHANRTGLLIDGRIVREWTDADLAQLRAAGRTFDEALAASVAVHPRPRGPDAAQI